MKAKKDNLEEFNVYEHLEILALHSVSISRDPSYTYRKICRWFSREFNTSLPQVVNLPVEFVLQHYYEHQFEGLKEEDLFNMMRHHADPDYVESEESNDDEFFRQITEEAEAAEKAKEAKLKEKDKKKTPEQQSYNEDNPPENTMKFKDLDENNEM